MLLLLLPAVTATECLLRSVCQWSPRTAAAHPAAVAAVAAMAAAAGTNLGLLLLLPMGARLAVGHVVVHRCALGSCRTLLLLLLLLLGHPHPLTRETESAVGKGIAIQQQQQQQGSVAGVRISTHRQGVAAVLRAEGGVDSHGQEQQVLLLLLLVVLLLSSSSRRRLTLLVAAVAAVGVGSG